MAALIDEIKILISDKVLEIVDKSLVSIRRLDTATVAMFFIRTQVTSVISRGLLWDTKLTKFR